MHHRNQQTLVSLLFLMIPTLSAQPPRPTSLAGRSAVYAPHGAIATSQPLATGAGLAVLQGGGNAIDAAVTAAAVLNVVEPHMTGIGGDLFTILWSAKKGRLVGLNASGRAGSEMTREELLRRGHERVPGQGAEAITVPGALSGWAALLDQYGTISLAQALQPAISLAEEGFPVSPIIARQWAAETDKLLQDEGARRTFLLNGKRPPRAGEWFKNPDLANTLKLIAREGIRVFYGGELGKRIVSRVHALGGFLTLEDLKKHKPDWIQPISVDFRGYRIWELPPNGQGIAALEMLRILEPYDLGALGHNTAPYLHRLIEAKKLAFADLYRYVGDPKHMSTPTQHLLSEAFIKQRRSRLDLRHATEQPEPGPAWTSSETIYLSAADQEGNMVSLINSVYSAFGSGVVAPGTGFALQNRGAGFTMKLGRANTVAPGKRPLHTIIPAFVTRPKKGTGAAQAAEEPWLSFGVMGGSMQPQGHVQVLLNILVFDMGLQQAIDAARFRHIAGRRVALETPIGDAVRKALTAMGHEIIDERQVSFGGSQAVMRLERGWMAGSDPRKDGMAAGH